jgi:hypothetical protein
MAYKSRHIKCSPSRAQYIVNPDFEPVVDYRPEYDKRRRNVFERSQSEIKYSNAWLEMCRLKDEEEPYRIVSPYYTPGHVREFVGEFIGQRYRTLGEARRARDEIKQWIQIDCPCHGWTFMHANDCGICYSESPDGQRD